MSDEIEDGLDELLFDDLNFTKVETSQLVIQPEMVNEGVYQNQDKIIDIDNIKLNHILKIGLGSVGSHTVFTLNKLGVSSFSLFDPDIVEKHNSASSMYDYASNFYNKLDGKRHPNQLHSLMKYPYQNAEINMFQHNEVSPFKVDQIITQLKRHDKETNLEAFKCGFGMLRKETISTFRRNVKKVGAPSYYTSNGVYDGIHNLAPNITIAKIDDFTSPSLAILTTDTIRSRFKSVLKLRNRLKSRKFFPIIDSAVANSLQGEVFCLDLFNDDDMLNWSNSMLKDKYDSFDLVLKDIKSNGIFENTFSLDDNFVCGDKMSIISSSQSSIIITALVRGLFQESTKPQFDNVNKLTNWSFLNGYMKPYMSSHQDINY